MIGLERGVYTIDKDALLSMLWYADGSGHDGSSVGIDGISDDWRITDITLQSNGLVRVELRRNEE